MHSTPLTLHKHLSPEILPESLGGILDEEDAVDLDLLGGLFTQEKDAYYRGFVLWFFYCDYFGGINFFWDF